MSRLITHADVTAVPDGGVLSLETDAQLTPLAAERVKARGITLQRVDHVDQRADAPDRDQLLREVAGQVVARLHGVGPEMADRVAQEVMAALDESVGPVGPAPDVSSSMDYCASFLEQERSRARSRAIITTTGRNKRGIVARLTAIIADLQGDVLDLSQTLVSDYFTMILVVDIASLKSSFADFKTAIEQAARDLQIQVMVMHEDIVASLNRV